MICFRDMTFCGSDCINTKCDRHFGAIEQEKAKSWWKRIRGDPTNGPLVAFADFSPECDRYKAPEKG